MSVLVDYKYANLLSTRLPRYKLKKSSPFLANFRCVICNDSQTKQNKCRGYLYEKSGNVKYVCHNCGVNYKIGYFLKIQFPDLFKEYLMDTFAEDKAVREADHILTPKKPEAEKRGGLLDGLKRVSQLHHDHPAKIYIDSRKIPPEHHAKLYFTPNFPKWINGLIPGKFEKEPKWDPRIVIPFFDKKGNVFAVTGRAISDKQSMRYITIRFDEEQPKVFGTERIDVNYRVWCLEGPIDSLFIPNAVAMGGADISLDELCRYLEIDKTRLVLVMDNEPRSVEINKRMKSAIDAGYKVLIWPKTVKEKDINNMVVKQGLTPANILMLMNKSVYSGLEANLKLAAWSKI